MTIIYILLGLLVFVLGGIAVIFNRLVQRRQLVNNGWSDIDVQLKRRADLVPRLVSSVKAYAAHERGLFEEVAAKRGDALNAGHDPSVRGQAESALSQPIVRLVAVAEDYPELKANETFLDLQKELADTEDKIEMARRFYNGAVREMNISVQSFPNIFVAGPFGYRQAQYFEISLADRATPALDLGGN